MLVILVRKLTAEGKSDPNAGYPNERADDRVPTHFGDD